MATSRVGVYPGTFNPFTLGHLAVAKAALDQRGLDRVHLAVSRVPLAKTGLVLPTFEHRVEALKLVAQDHDWLDVVVTDAQLLVDISVGYNLLIMGADKWHQIHEVRFYDDDPNQRDAAIAALPQVALAPRPPLEIPDHLDLEIAEEFADVSSTAVRNGRHDWMHPAI
ncbi:MAG: adenylyltransferase/cytidyltransferase family protein, partial [Actinobacteria bacterium]|nr:adenylyltransferase/cytidyltransferase family protein [Actinomycetota bacterium]